MKMPGIKIEVSDRQAMWDIANDIISKTKKPADTIGTRRRPDIRACLALILSRPTVTGPLATSGQLVIG